MQIWYTNMADQNLCHARGHVGETREYVVPVWQNIAEVLFNLYDRKHTEVCINIFDS